MLLSIFPLIILAIASYRLTRFLVIDSLPAGLRNKLFGFLINRAQKENKVLHAVWEKLYELLSCTWCSGWWLSAGLYWAYRWVSPLSFGRLDIINIFAIAGIQGFLHSLEPDDE